MWFDFAFSYERKEALETEGFQEITIKPIEYQNTVSRFDFTFFAIETENNIEFSFEYSTELFSKETIDLLKERFMSLLISIVDNHSNVIEKLNFKTSCELELMEKTEKVEFDF